MSESALQAIHRGMSRGVAWMMLFKVTERAVSLVSVTVLARLLVPADFGLVALAMSTIGLLEVLGAFGLDVALIRQADASRRHFDAVWTFNVLFGCGVAILTACLAPVAASLYGDPRLVGVMLVLALSRAIAGFESTGIVNFRKELQFDREFRFMVAKRLLTSVLVTIPLAIVWRSYYALLAGTLAGTCIAVGLSYALHPYRPRPSLAGLSELMHFSKWLLLSSLLQFLHGRMADFVVGRAAGTSALGAFTLARELARMPVGDVAAPVNRAVFPGYVKLAGDRQALKRAYVQVVSRLLLLVVPAGVGLCVLAEPAVSILLGPQWSTAVPVVKVLAVNAVLLCLVGTAHHVNLAVGMARSTSLVLALHVAVSLPLMLWLVPRHGAEGAAMAALAASVVAAPFNFVLLGRAIAFRVGDALSLLWRPSVAALAMSIAIGALRDRMTSPAGLSWEIGNACLLVVGGAMIYAVTLLGCWALAGDSESAEAWAVARVRASLRFSARE